MIITGFGDAIADRLRAEHTTLAARWFERLSSLLPVHATEVFPTSSLLDHVPSLIVDISEYVRAPEDEAIAANTAVLDKARELGGLRHAQRASLHQVLREYQVLGSVLVAFVQEQTATLTVTPLAEEVVSVVSRLHAAVDVLRQATVETFVGLYTQTITEQAERLEQFTRMATHEWRQPLASLLFAVNLLRREDLDSVRIQRTLDLVDRNVAHLVQITHKIESLARLQTGGDDPVVQQVSLGTIAEEAARQLREMAEARGVDIRVGGDLPSLTIDVGRLELALVNLLSNAIKYCDPRKPVRYVEISAGRTADDWCELVLRDNGIGIPAEHLPTIFDRFSRAHADREDLRHVTGIGLGLSIVEDCVRAVGGRITVESEVERGTTFVIALPAR